MDSRIKDQNARMKQLEAENRSLKTLCKQHKFNENATLDVANQEKERLESLEEDNRQLVQENRKLTKSIKALKRVLEEKERGSPRNGSIQSDLSINGTSSEASNMMIEVLKENNDNLRKTNEHLIQTNETVLQTNKALVNELNEAKQRFQQEQEQWRRNWEMLKLHFEMQSQRQ